MRSGRLSAVLVCIATSLVAAPAAQARSVTLTSPASGATTCTLKVKGQTASTTVPTRGAPRATLRMQINPHAAAGTYRVSLSCPPVRPVTARVRVSRSRAARRGVALGGAVRVTLGPKPSSVRPIAVPAKPSPGPAPSPAPPAGPVAGPNPKLPVIQHPDLSADAIAYADALWTDYWSAPTLQRFQNGECVALAAQMRWDIVVRAYKTAIAQWWMAGADGTVPGLYDWNAGTWDAHAASAGMEVGAEPRVGAIMVFHSSPTYLSPTGHVAYVNAVHADGSLTITEEHAPLLFVITQRELPAREMSGQDIDFIY
jgi:hypothetical protein